MLYLQFFPQCKRLHCPFSLEFAVCLSVCQLPRLCLADIFWALYCTQQYYVCTARSRPLVSSMVSGLDVRRCCVQSKDKGDVDNGA